MQIKVNGEAHTVEAADLSALLAELGYGDGRVATAVNEEFVPKALRGQRRIAEGDRIEILTARQGG